MSEGPRTIARSRSAAPTMLKIHTGSSNGRPALERRSPMKAIYASPRLMRSPNAAGSANPEGSLRDTSPAIKKRCGEIAEEMDRREGLQLLYPRLLLHLRPDNCGENRRPAYNPRDCTTGEIDYVHRYSSSVTSLAMAVSGGVAAVADLLARLFGERYESLPPWGVTRRCLPGGISRRGEPSHQSATGQGGVSRQGSGRPAWPARRPRPGWSRIGAPVTARFHSHATFG